ncbi:hypothetical protein K461DRAFT_292660 [Myriangium duriaei CBS 260.36]|uniref:Uncharacterized protein n=1 Tax=Myriangium duriaei CBS 260.36 TaxID=1168546 RepID=A0A9P4J3A4_9PEZI|nr:hypothetical protein K461DRAFT_292660 [Myriangium duriaei CBS 260.36]
MEGYNPPESLSDIRSAADGQHHEMGPVFRNLASTELKEYFTLSSSTQSREGHTHAGKRHARAQHLQRRLVESYNPLEHYLKVDEGEHQKLHIPMQFVQEDWQTQCKTYTRDMKAAREHRNRSGKSMTGHEIRFLEVACQTDSHCQVYDVEMNRDGSSQRFAHFRPPEDQSFIEPLNGAAPSSNRHSVLVLFTGQDQRFKAVADKVALLRTDPELARFHIYAPITRIVPPTVSGHIPDDIYASDAEEHLVYLFKHHIPAGSLVLGYAISYGGLTMALSLLHLASCHEQFHHVFDGIILHSVPSDCQPIMNLFTNFPYWGRYLPNMVQRWGMKKFTGMHMTVSECEGHIADKATEEWRNVINPFKAFFAATADDPTPLPMLSIVDTEDKVVVHKDRLDLFGLAQTQKQKDNMMAVLGRASHTQSTYFKESLDFQRLFMVTYMDDPRPERIPVHLSGNISSRTHAVVEFPDRPQSRGLWSSLMRS